MKKNHSNQYTIRNISLQLDRKLREVSKDKGESLNQVVLDMLKKGVGLDYEEVFYHDLDPLIGSWQEDLAFDQAIQAQDQIDENLWK